jgi:hypothetical protein
MQVNAESVRRRHRFLKTTVKNVIGENASIPATGPFQPAGLAVLFGSR